MKNAMKKLMSLLLVAVLLVSALPMAASAAALGDPTDGDTGTSTPSTPGATFGALGDSDGSTPSTPSETGDLGGDTTLSNGTQNPGKTRTTVQEPDATVNSMAVQVWLHDSAATEGNGWSQVHTGTVVLESHETYFTAVGVMTKHYASTYATATITGVEIWGTGTAPIATREADRAIYPGDYTNGEYCRIVLEKVQPVSVWVKYNDRTYGKALIDIPNKTSISIAALLDKASTHEEFAGLNIIFKDYSYMIGGEITARSTVYPGEHVVFQLEGGNAYAGGTMGSIPGSGTDTDGTVGGGSSTTTGTVDIIFVQNGIQTPYYGIKINANGATVRQAMSYFSVNTNLFQSAYINGVKASGLDASFTSGATVYIYLNNTNNGGTTNSGTMNENLWYPVYLDVFMDNTVGATPARTFNITEGIAADGLVTKNEVVNLLVNHYNAKTSKGIQVDGLYLAMGNWSADFVVANRSSSISNINELRQQNRVHISVVLYNATAKSSGTPDTSNPKTGDSIYLPIAVLGTSAAALAAVMFFYSKKRMAR